MCGKVRFFDILLSCLQIFNLIGYHKDDYNSHIIYYMSYDANNILHYL